MGVRLTKFIQIMILQCRLTLTYLTSRLNLFPNGSGENGYLFSGSWGALVIIFRDLGSKLIVLGIREPCKKVKKSHLKEKPSFCFD